MKEVVIKISDAIYKYITMEHPICIKEVGEYLFVLVRCTGTLLPEGHGRLKDVDWIDDNYHHCYADDDGSWAYRWEDINNAPTIIEADKGGE